MLNNSCLFAIPEGINKKLIFNLDGIRIALQVINLSYQRLCQSLESVSQKNEITDFTHISLDCWAFIDSLDRLRGMWNNLDKILELDRAFSKVVVDKKFENVRNIRNIISHLPQRIDSLISSNSSAMGEIGWIYLSDKASLNVKTYFIRYGAFYKKVNFEFTLPNTNIRFNQNNVGLIEFKVGEFIIELSNLYFFVEELVKYLEKILIAEFSQVKSSNMCPPCVFGSADLNTNGWLENT
jgi:hypothetical protein